MALRKKVKRKFVVQLVKSSLVETEVVVEADSFDEARKKAVEVGPGPNNVWHRNSAEDTIVAGNVYNSHTDRWNHYEVVTVVK